MRIILTAAFAFVLLSFNALAEDRLMVMDGVVQPSRNANTVGYVTLHNTGTSSVTLSSLSSTAAQHVDAHETEIDDNGVARMRPLTPVTIAPDEMLSFVPGGNHLMIMGVEKPLAVGEIFPLELHYSDGMTQATLLEVQPPEPIN